MKGSVGSGSNRIREYRADQPGGARREPADAGAGPNRPLSCWAGLFRGLRTRLSLAPTPCWAHGRRLFGPFRVEAYGRALAQLVAGREPDVLLLGNSGRGHDLAAWVAAQLDLGLAADGTDIAVRDGRVVVTRPVYAGKLLSDVYVTEGVQVVTLRSRAFAPASATGGSGEAEWVQPAVSEEQIGATVQGFESAGSVVSLTDARIIVRGGRGVGGRRRASAGWLGNNAAVGACALPWTWLDSVRQR